jgi:hypothetical protein
MKYRKFVQSRFGKVQRNNKNISQILWECRSDEIAETPKQDYEFCYEQENENH